MSPAVNRGLRKALRSIIQVVASGGLTAAIDAIGGGLSPQARIYVAAAWLIVVVFCQNLLETKGSIPTLLPSPGLITRTPGAMVTKTVGTLTDSKGGRSGGDGPDGPGGAPVVAEAGAVVEAAIDESGRVVGDVLDTAGEVVGDVTGQVGDAVEDVGGAVGGIVGGVVGGVLPDDDPERRGDR